MAWQSERLNSAWVDWIVEHDWNAFGTLNFAPGKKPFCADAARQSWRRFWNKLDRLAYGQTGHRIERAVFEHYGANGENAHCHFLIQIPFDTKIGCTAVNGLWRSMTESAAPPTMNEITPIINPSSATNYGLREAWKLDADTCSLALSHINPPGAPAHKQAMQRVLAAVDEHWLSEAHKVLPGQIEAAKERYKRRHR